MRSEVVTIFWVCTMLVLTSSISFAEVESPIATGTLRKACSQLVAFPQPPSRVDTTNRLAALRKLMNTSTEISDMKPLQAVLITSDDEHQTEFVSNYDKRLEYISGFSGRIGDAIVTIGAAALWVDPRYHIQANDQLDCNWLLMREGNRLVPSKAKWLKKQFPYGARIAADPKLLSADAWNTLERELQEQSDYLVLVKTPDNLIDKIWSNHNETEQEKLAFTLDDNYSGKKWTDKVNETREELKKLNVDGMVVTALDEIAWLLNIRGRDIPYTRFVKSYLLLSQKEVFLYVDKNKTMDNVTVFFNAKMPGTSNSTVTIKPYDEILSGGGLNTFCQLWKTVLVPAKSVYSPGASKEIYDTVPKEQRVSRPSPIIHLKAQKNPTEIKGMENAHVRDGVAMCKFLEYLESRFRAGFFWDEMKAATEIDRFRMVQELAVNVSFPTMVAFGPHGAQPNYQPSKITSKKFFDNSTIVIDSGGQYVDGTTDVTRTIHLGNPTEEQKDVYTKVLIGSIQLSSLTFPDSLEVSSVDILARAPLWELGMDYAHETGHGIGAFLGVHESPIAVHYNSIQHEYFKPGYFFTNGPGMYIEDDFGIRLENVLRVIDKPQLKHTYGPTYLGFEDITLVPYCYKLINVKYLSYAQRKWLNNYNSRIRRHVGPELKRQKATEAFYWMMENTKYIPNSQRSIRASLFLLFLCIALAYYL